MAYPGYVYHEYPKMIYDASFENGYKIVNSEEEEQASYPVKDAVEQRQPVTKKPSRPKLKFDMED